jgi:hypothetical protein
MNPIYWLLAAVAIPSRLVAVDAGLYDISDGSHPKLLQDQVEQVTISSQSNDNKRYYLALHASHSFSLPCNQIGLIVGNKTIRFTSMETTVDDPEVIPQIAQYFHAKVQKRRHPGHQMLVEFIPDKAEFSAGESVTVRLRITNIGDAEFAFIQGGRQRGSRDNQFAFSAELVGNKMVPDTGDPRNFGGMGTPVTIKPGQSHEIAVDLAKWFNFKEGGTYNLRGSYNLEFIDPHAQDLYTIWEDYACGEFTVRIKSKQGL